MEQTKAHRKIINERQSLCRTTDTRRLREDLRAAGHEGKAKQIAQYLTAFRNQAEEGIWTLVAPTEHSGVTITTERERLIMNFWQTLDNAITLLGHEWEDYRIDGRSATSAANGAKGGRPRLTDKPLVTTAYKLTESQREFVQAQGGASFLRELIERAR